MKAASIVNEAYLVEKVKHYYTNDKKCHFSAKKT